MAALTLPLQSQHILSLVSLILVTVITFSFVRRLIPDLTFRTLQPKHHTANFTLKARNFPGGAYLQSNNKAVEKTASVPVEQFTQDAHVRLRGRSVWRSELIVMLLAQDGGLVPHVSMCVAMGGGNVSQPRHTILSQCTTGIQSAVHI